MIPKDVGAMTMQQFRPITNLSSSYKLCSAEVADRMARTFEEFGVWHDSQEGARRQRNTRRSVYNLVQMIERGKRAKQVVVVVQLDFNSAFTSASQRAVRRTLDAYGIPLEDIALIQRMQDGSWYYVENAFEQQLRATSRMDLSKAARAARTSSSPTWILSSEIGRAHV